MTASDHSARLPVHHTAGRWERRRGALIPGALLTSAVLVAGCGAADQGDEPEVESVAATGTGAPPEAGSSGATGLEAIFDAAEWPDACDLGNSASGLSAPRPSPGTLPDGTPLDGAQECRWAMERSAGSDADVTLRIVIITSDVLEAWAGYQYGTALSRDVTDVGDEAFLLPRSTDDAETLWVCKGQTIFTVETGDLAQEEARDVMFSVANAASDELSGTPAGTPPSS